MKYKGLKWFKCDLHMHTPMSKCFLNKEIKPSEYLDKVVEKGLEVIAITDHNTAGWIDELKIEAKKRNVTLFPGVELTVGDKKTHLLILFDIDKTDTDVEDFLIALGISRGEFSEENIFVNKTLDDVIKQCLEKDLLVIPSHVDNHSGLCELSNNSYKKIINSNLFKSVHISHEASNNNVNMNVSMYSEIDHPRKTDIVNMLVEINKNNLCKLTFSDNPDKDDNKKHGLDGIGEMYTWIKLKDNPDLKSLKQSLNIGSNRTKNIYTSKDIPYVVPNMWIESLSFKETKINKDEIKVCFSPQMTSIIGGRGTGKSTIISFIRGILKIDHKVKEMKNDFDIYFSSKTDGILTNNTEVILVCNLESEKYKIKLNISQRNEIILYKLNKENFEYEEVEEKDVILNRIREEIEIYSQKELFEIAHNTNNLLEIIDSDIKIIAEKKDEIIENENKFKVLYFRKNEIKKEKSEKIKIEEEISLDKRIISGLEQSNYKELLEKEIKYEQILNSFNSINEKLDQNIEVLKDLDNDMIIKKVIDEPEIQEIISKFNEFLKNKNLKKIISEIELEKVKFCDHFYKSHWVNQKNENLKEIEKIKSEIKDLDITTIFDRLKDNEKKLVEVDKKLEEEEEIEKEIENTLKTIEKLRKEIVECRKDYTTTILKNSDINIEIKDFRDEQSFENKIRSIIKRPSEFAEDIKVLVRFLFDGIIIRNKNNLIELITKVKNDESVEGISFTSRFKTIISNLTEEDMVNIHLIYPDDKLEIKYEGRVMKNLSPGQKTSIILSYLLSRANKTIILDQPEDDLDNKLIYKLIVKESVKNKEKRQIITVTHNANIPVNGETEWTIIMESTGKTIKVKEENTIDNTEIIEGICDIMEGGLSAFKLREDKYKINIK